jgi:hypothetical protein
VKKSQKGIDVSDYDLIVGSGGILSHSPRAATSKMLVDALEPKRKTRLAADSVFMLPQLGALSVSEPALAAELFHSLGLVVLERDGVAPDDPPPQRAPSFAGTTVKSGPLTVRREMAAEGEVLVEVGETVTPGTVVGRCTRKFLRPFFLPVAQVIEVEPAALPEYLLTGVGEEIAVGQVLARRSLGFLRQKTYESPVAGTVRRILPDGTLVVREKEEQAQTLRAVSVAKELGVDPLRLKPHLKVEVDQEVERGQALASRFVSRGLVSCPSPFRGRVERIDRDFGIILIAPIEEELEVSAWCPGVVSDLDSRGVTIAAEATEITGVWGHGGEAVGVLRVSSRGPGAICVLPHAGRSELDDLAAVGVAGLVAGSLDFADVLEAPPPFPIVLTEGFGRRSMSAGVLSALRSGEGRIAVMDGTTELRVGVRRPRLILP